MRGLGQPPRRFVERAQLQQGVGNDPGHGISAADLVEHARVFLFLAALEEPGGFAGRTARRPPRPCRATIDFRRSAIKRSARTVRWPSAAATARPRSRSSVKSRSQIVDGVLGPRRVEQDIGQQSWASQPLAVGPGDARRPTRAARPPHRPTCSPSGPAPASRNSSRNSMVAGGARPGRCRRSSRSAVPSRSPAVHLERELIAADRLGRPGQPEVIGGSLGRPGDLFGSARSAGCSGRRRPARPPARRSGSRRRRPGCPPWCDRSHAA